MSEPAPQRRTSVLAILGVLVLQALAVGWAMEWDLFVGDIAHTPFPALTFALTLLPALVVLLVALVGRLPRPVTRLSAALLVGVLVLPFVTWHPRKVFMQGVLSLRNGMTVDEVESVLGAYIHGAGAKWVVPDGPAPLVRAAGDEAGAAEEDAALRTRVEAAQAAYTPPVYGSPWERAHFSGTMTYRWTNDGSWDADWGHVSFFKGRVVQVEFLRD